MNIRRQRALRRMRNQSRSPRALIGGGVIAGMALGAVAVFCLMAAI